MADPLPNYIRTNRRRLGLSQRHIATLLGMQNASTVLRHEDYQRLPALSIALAYAHIFQEDPREIFAGLYEEIAAEIEIRARQLLEKSGGKALEPAVRDYLSLLVRERLIHYVPCEE